jgi:hypothetical protein
MTKVVLKPDLSKAKGEDSHFSTQNDVGVFDGVGGWRDSGIDVSEFSIHLANSVKEYTLASRKKLQNINLIDALHAGLASIKSNQITGSSTACLFTVLNDNTAQILNLGDSGAIIFRPSLLSATDDPKSKSMIYFQTEAQCHSFNFPFQMGNIADKLKKFEDGSNFDSPNVSVLCREVFNNESSRELESFRDSDAELIKKYLLEYKGNISKVAKRLKVSRGLIYRRIQELSIDISAWKSTS